MRHRLIFFCLCFFCSLIVYGQNISITGNVKDKNGDPLIGVTVQVKGTTSGTVTDFDGNYVLNDISKKSVLAQKKLSEPANEPGKPAALYLKCAAARGGWCGGIGG